MSDIAVWQHLIDAEIKRRNRKIGLPELEDLRQDLYVAILEARADSATDVQRVCRRVLSGNRTNADQISMSDPVLQNELIPADVLRDPRRLAAVRRAVEDLPQPDQLVILQMFYEGQAIEDVAKSFGQSVAWVRRVRDAAFKQITISITKEQ